MKMPEGPECHSIAMSLSSLLKSKNIKSIVITGGRYQKHGPPEGYTEFCDFDISQIRLIEVLRTRRVINYAAWLGKRWSDPAFPKSFPWFNTPRYWSDHILELREQLSAIQEEPLRLL